MRDLTDAEMSAALAMPVMVVAAKSIDLEAARRYAQWCRDRASWTSATSIIRLAQGDVTMNDERRLGFSASAEARLATKLVELVELVVELDAEKVTVPRG